MKYFIGIDIGATKTEVVLVDEKGKVLNSFKVLTGKNKKKFLEVVFNLIRKLRIKKVSGIGIGVPGQVNNGILVKAPNLPFAQNFNLKKIIQKKFKIKTLVENDANCFALAEARLRKKKNLVGLTLGSGVGGGIIIGGEIHHGKDNLAGEFGQIVYKNKTYEDYCSGKFFERKIFNKKNFEEYGNHFGNLIDVVVNSLNPEMVVLGGSVVKSFSLFKKSMKRSFKSKLTYPQLKRTQIVVSKNKHAGAIGAAFLHNL